MRKLTARMSKAAGEMPKPYLKGSLPFLAKKQLRINLVNALKRSGMAKRAIREVTIQVRTPQAVLLIWATEDRQA